jgi:hypothetical protein
MGRVHGLTIADPEFKETVHPTFTTMMEELDAIFIDAIVIGSGCGGGLIAGELASAGYKGMYRISLFLSPCDRKRRVL